MADDETPGQTYFVSVTGDDDNTGSIENPLSTIQKAAKIMQPGDTAYIRQGNYREAVTLDHSGRKGHHIRTRAFKQERAVIDGTDPLDVEWDHWKENIFKFRVPALVNVPGRSSWSEICRS